jgi:hypothetical protein
MIDFRTKCPCCSEWLAILIEEEPEHGVIDVEVITQEEMLRRK